MIKIGLFGASGRMGQAIERLIAAEADLSLAGGTSRADNPGATAARSDVLIDFSAPAALERHVEAAVATRRPIVVGTTGLGLNERRAITEASTRIAVMAAANMSIGVTVLAKLVTRAAAELGPEWDIEIVEMHHRAKVDSPSGTALMLGQAAAAGRGIDLAEVRNAGPCRPAGERSIGSIGFASLRGGTVTGEHEVILAGPGERLVLGHIAEDRDIFAKGALAAARWLKDRPPGLYTMSDLLSGDE